MRKPGAPEPTFGVLTSSGRRSGRRTEYERAGRARRAGAASPQSDGTTGVFMPRGKARVASPWALLCNNTVAQAHRGAGTERFLELEFP